MIKFLRRINKLSNCNLRLALEELEFFSREVRILGVYPQHPFRISQKMAAE
jgi:prephenate dehydratase